MSRGLASEIGGTLQRPNRILKKYLDEHEIEGGALARLFNDVEGYQRNFKGVLERRIGQLHNLDPELRKFLLRAVEDLPNHPNVFLTNVRGIVNRALDLIWDAELEGKRRIPSEWYAIWKHNKERGIEEWQTAFPQGGARVRLLGLMTGNQKSDACAKYVGRATYALVNAAYTFGDLGQHQEGTVVYLGAAYSALHLCIELAAALARELPTK